MDAEPGYLEANREVIFPVVREYLNRAAGNLDISKEEAITVREAITQLRSVEK